MKYTAPSFSVNPSAAKAPADCKHGWVDQKRGRCILCGMAVDTGPYGMSVIEREMRDSETTELVAPTQWHSGGAVTKGRGYTHIALNVFAAPCSDFSKPEDWGQ